jgi:IS605 OrfB family transposase
VYNKALAYAIENRECNFMRLRDKFVTYQTSKETLQADDVYNDLVDALKLEQSPGKVKALKTQIADIKRVAKVVNPNVNEWMLTTPKETRAGAVEEVSIAYKAALTNLRNGNIKHFTLKPRLKKHSRQHCVLSTSLLKKTGDGGCIAKTFWANASDALFKFSKRDSKKHKSLVIAHDSKILKDGTDYFLCVPVDAPVVEMVKPQLCCGIDPGIRTFLTMYSSDGTIREIHHQAIFDKLNTKLDLLEKLKKRKQLLDKIRRKKMSLKDEVHWKTINYLCKTYSDIFIGDIESQSIQMNSLNRKVNRGMSDIAFFTFKQRLAYKAALCGCKVRFVKENHTSKTCSCCGSIYNVCSSKTYNCPNCKTVMDRDHNAAKNILMRGLLNL